MIICFYKSTEIKPHPIMTPNIVNSDSPLLKERDGRVFDLNESCWGEALLSSDMQYKCATQGTMIVALKLVT
jgi:hypothetical protein